MFNPARRYFEGRKSVLRGVGRRTCTATLLWLSCIMREKAIPAAIAMKCGQGKKCLIPSQRPELARKLESALKQDDVAGVVITHGTDTMEETAWFIDLVVKSDKLGTVAAMELNPQKARVRPLLSLMKTSNPKEVQDRFLKY